MGFGGAGGDDANDFLILLLIKTVDNQENRARADSSHRDPTLFLFRGRVEGWVGLCDGPRIVEHQNGCFKPNIMLTKVPVILALVPFESHDGSATCKQRNGPAGWMSTHLYVHQ